MKNNKIKNMVVIMMVVSFFIQSMMPITAYAQGDKTGTKAYDTVSREYSNAFSHTKRYVSLSPDVGTEGMSEAYKIVSFTVLLKGAIQYDRISGAYVSASTPTATLIYAGPVNLRLDNVSTFYRDNGNSITFYYTASVVGVVDPGIPVTIYYGSLSDSFTISK